MSFVSSKGNILCRLIKIELYKIFAIINRAIKGLQSPLYIRYCTPKAWLTLVMLRWIPAISWPLIGQAVSTHLQMQTNCWSDWTQIWWGNSLCVSLAWLIFVHAPLNSHCLVAFVWLSIFCAFADRLLIRFSSNLVGQLIIEFSKPD